MAAASAVVDRLLRRLAAIGPDELPSAVVEDMIHVRKALSRWHVVLESTEKQLFEGVSGEYMEMRKALMSKENKMRKIKQIAYYIEDILDEFEGCGRSGSGGSSGRSEEVFCCSSGPSFLPSTMASRMKMVRKKLDRESEKSIIFQLLHHSKPDLVTTDGHGSSDLNSIIGRENDKANIKIIINDAGPFSIIPIVGLSGIGKTALARLIFNDRGEDCKFDHHIWISLNMSFDLCYIVNGIISQAGNKGEGPSQKNKWTLRNLLQEILTDKRSLVVLDDLWSMDRNQLDELKEMMSTVICSVIVTTCSEEVAKLFNTVSPYKLGLLSDSDCWTIFSGVASEDQETRDHVVRLCQGMPIVAHSLSSVVHAKGKNVLKDANNKELWHLEKRLVPKVKMFRPLEQIYYRMPSGLKSCLGYLSIFPKGFHIDTEKLIWQWSALDMLGSSHGILSPYVQGKNYIQSLLSIFFLQAPDPCLANGTVLTNGKNVLEMHSLVHSFARYLSCDELIILEDQIAPVKSKKKVTFRYALLLECNEASTISKGFLTRARAISFKGCKGRKLPEEALSALRHLNVLDLSGCSFLELPSSVGQLKHLRYLDVSHSAVQSLPSELRHLQNLEALDLSKTSVSVPLDPIGPFQKLKYLNLQECPNLRDLLRTFGDLKGLEHLNLSRCSGVSELPETLCGFSALQLLDLSGCAELEKLPQSLGSLKNLGDLNLSGCSRLEQLSESFHELYSLKFLNLESCSMLQQLPHLFGNLKTLEILNLAGCISLQELPKSFGDLYFLRVLNLEGCFGLQESPEFLGNLLNLENLNLSHISLELPEALINLRRLHTLDLTGCGFKKSFADIVNKMTNLKFVLTDDSRLALSFSRHIVVSTENNKQSCLASHMVQSSDLERDGIMGETGAEEILETPETRKGIIDRANPQQETSNPFQLIAMENKASTADVFGYSSENVECSAEDSLDTTIEMQPHRQGKEKTPTEEDPEDFNPRASSTLSSRISADSLNTTVEKQTHRQRKKENPAKQDLEDFSPCASCTVNRLPEKQRKEQGQEISEYSSDDEQHSRNISGRQDDKGKPWRKTLLALQNAITWKKQEYRSDSQQMYHLVKKEKSLQLYTFSRIKVSTLNFSDRIGLDGFASYYKGQLSDGVEIQVKRYSRDGLTEAKNEIEVTTSLLHRNILRPRGCCFKRKPEMSCCIKGNNEEEIILIYDYMPNKSLDYFIFDTVGRMRVLDWPERRRIIYGIAQGLIYLHEYSEFTVIHLDIKPYNILLDYDMNPKIRNFDISRILPSGVTEDEGIICGTFGYLDPLFYTTGICSVKSDVYSFGVTMLETISGEKCVRAIGQGEHLPPRHLPSRACRLWMDGNWHEIIDPTIYHTYEDTEIRRFIHVALLCIQIDLEDRPTMHDVTEMLRHESIFRPEPKLLLFDQSE
ncbi:uncharacterized protein [Miscanthus floridulus]|uniref:uncharacterized protein isoform X3 n=1 Tax=Miscanthus floridulus TaxID=154761 RepID=UPI003458BE54